MDKEALLRKAINDNLDREIAMVPDAAQIRRMHVFSHDFIKRMNEMTGKRKRLWTRKHTGMLAAAVLCLFLIVRVMPERLTGSSDDADSAYDTGADEEMVSESADGGDVSESEAESDMEENGSAAGPVIDEEADDSNIGYTAVGEQAKLSLDQASYQPDDTIILSLTNLSSTDLVSGSRYEIEGYAEDQWQVLVTSGDEIKAVQRVSEMETVVTEIDLSLLELEEGYTRYRIVKAAGEEVLAVEFEIIWP